MAKKNNGTKAPVNKTTEAKTDTAAPVTDSTTTPTDETPTTAETSERQTTAATADDTASDTQTDDTLEVQEVSESMKRAELDAVATEAGLVNVSKYENKGVVVDAINRVRGGEDAEAVDTELAPVVDDKGGEVEVEVAAPFYDLQQEATRRVGDKYKTTETRATELRGRKLVK